MAIFGAKIELFGPKLILKNFSGVKMVPKQVFTGAGFKSPNPPIFNFHIRGPFK